MKEKIESEVAQLCPTPCDPMDCSLPGSSVHWIFQARVLEWVAIAFSDLGFRLTLKTACEEGLALHSSITHSNVKGWGLLNAY